MSVLLAKATRLADALGSSLSDGVGTAISAVAIVDFAFDGKPRRFRAGAEDVTPLPRCQRDRSAAD